VKVVVIGATGTIGSAVADALAPRHEVIRASRKSEVKVDVRDAKSLSALFDKIENVDAVVSCGGEVGGLFAPFDQLSDAQFERAVAFMMSGVHLVRTCAKHLRDGGSITVTTGQLATHPLPGTSALTMAGAGAEGFVRAAALEMPRKIRLNSVSPGWVKETMEKMGMDSSPGMPAKTLAAFYVKVVEGNMNGTIIDPTA
jgi:NAD(P)-dependent dehydrogenase (short-subunit alcohol dehydrogenase family)